MAVPMMGLVTNWHCNYSISFCRLICSAKSSMVSLAFNLHEFFYHCNLLRWKISKLAIMIFGTMKTKSCWVKPCSRNAWSKEDDDECKVHWNIDLLLIRRRLKWWKETQNDRLYIRILRMKCVIFLRITIFVWRNARRFATFQRNSLYSSY